MPSDRPIIYVRPTDEEYTAIEEAARRDGLTPAMYTLQSVLRRVRWEEANREQHAERASR